MFKITRPTLENWEAHYWKLGQVRPSTNAALLHLRHSCNPLGQRSPENSKKQSNQGFSGRRIRRREKGGKSKANDNANRSRSWSELAWSTLRREEPRRHCLCRQSRSSGSQCFPFSLFYLMPFRCTVWNLLLAFFRYLRSYYGNYLFKLVLLVRLIILSFSICFTVKASEV